MVYYVNLPNGVSVEFEDDVSKNDARMHVMQNLNKYLTEEKPPAPPKTSFLGGVGEFFKGIPYGVADTLLTAAQGGAGVVDALSGESDPAYQTERPPGWVERQVAGARDYMQDSWLSPKKGYEDSTGRQIGQGVGSAAALAPTMLLAPEVGIPALIGLSAATGAGEQKQRIEEAKKAGKFKGTQADADNAVLMGMIPGATELAPELTAFGLARATPVGRFVAPAMDALAKIPGVKQVLGGLSHATPDSYKQIVGRTLGAALVSGGVEGVQNAVQGVMQDAIEKGYYNPEKAIGDDILKDAALGFGVGAIFGAAVRIPEAARERRDMIRNEKQAGQDEELRAFLQRIGREDQAARGQEATEAAQASLQPPNVPLLSPPFAPTTQDPNLFPGASIPPETAAAVRAVDDAEKKAAILRTQGTGPEDVLRQAAPAPIFRPIDTQSILAQTFTPAELGPRAATVAERVGETPTGRDWVQAGIDFEHIRNVAVQRDADTQAAVRDILSKVPRSTPTKLAQATGKPVEQVKAAIARDVAAGRVQETKRGVKLAQTPPEPTPPNPFLAALQKTGVTEIGPTQSVPKTAMDMGDGTRVDHRVIPPRAGKVGHQVVSTRWGPDGRVLSDQVIPGRRFPTNQTAQAFVDSLRKQRLEQTVASPPPAKPAPVDRAPVETALRNKLDNYGLRDVALAMKKAIESNPDAEGAAHLKAKLIELATDLYSQKLTNAQMVERLGRVMDHEVIHILKSLGLLSPKEWAVLQTYAASRKRADNGLTYLEHINRTRRDLTGNPEVALEEAIADAFRDYATIAKTPMPPQVRGLFGRIVDFFRRMVGSRRQGEDPGAIMDKIISGEVGARERSAAPTGETKYSESPPTIDVDGVLRSTINSDGRKIHPTDGGVRNFWRWFGDSKMIDALGRPLVFYHGTSDSVNAFDINHPNRKDSGWIGTGVYVSSNNGIASAYANLKRGRAGPNVMALYVKMENPKSVTHAQKEKWKFQALGAGPNSEIGRQLADSRTAEWREAGHDGATLEYQAEDVGPDNVSVEAVVFDPENVKSATGNSGAFSPSTADIRYSESPPTLERSDSARYSIRDEPPTIEADNVQPWSKEPFYSAVTRVVHDMPIDGGTGAEILGYIRNQPGVKENEIKWTGLDEFLSTKPGANRPAQFSKAEVAAFMNANQTRLMEVTKYGVDVAQTDAQRRSPSRYGQFTLPGGRNYREFVLWLSNKDGPKEEDLHNTSLPTVAPTKFQSEHWDEPDVIMHFRTKNRFDTRGRKVLFVEEIQSDWHQQGRKYGYQADAMALRRSGVSSPAVQQEYRLLAAAKDAAVDAYNNARTAALRSAFERLGEPQWRPYASDTWIIANASPEAGEKLRLADVAYERADTALDALGMAMANGLTTAVEPAPLAKSWHETALRRLLRLAAQEGYGAMAWTNGAVQNLRRQVAVDDKGGQFYDKILVEYGNKFGKKFGAQVYRGSIDTAGWISPSNSYDDRFKMLLSQADREAMNAAVSSEPPHPASASVPSDEVVRKILKAARTRAARTWFIDITREMSDSMRGGVPLYSLRPGAIAADPPAIQDAAERALTDHVNDRTSAWMRKITRDATLPFTGKLKHGPIYVEDMIRIFQDDMIGWKHAQDRLREQNISLPEWAQPYLQETLFHGRAGSELEDKRRELYTPFREALARAHKGWNGDVIRDLGMYLAARHAPERNQWFRDRIKQRTVDEAGKATTGPAEIDSGISDERAAQILKDLDDAGKTAKLDELAQHAYKILQDADGIALERGLRPDFTTQDMIDKGAPNFKQYVPMRGFDMESTDGVDNMGVFGAGRGYNVRGRETPRMAGRRTGQETEDGQPINKEPDYNDIVDNIIAQHSRTLIRAHKNEVGKALLNFIRETNPQNERDKFDTVNPANKHMLHQGYIIDTAPQTATLESRDGGIYLRTTRPDLGFLSQDNVVGVKDEGKQYYVVLNDPRMARPFRRLYEQPSGIGHAMTITLGRVNRMLAGLATAYNPEFLVVNFPRDLQTAAVLGAQYDLKNLGAKTVARLPSIATAIRAWQKMRDPSTLSAKDRAIYDAWLEMRKHGGTTEYLGLNDLDSQIKKTQESITNLEPSSLQKVKDAIIGENGLLGMIDKWNQVLENATRLSAFMSAREKGLSPQQAAFIAKNITVNFNKGGEAKLVLNSLYLFYNASIQGSVNMLRGLVYSPKLRRYAAAMVAAGAAMDALNSLLMGDDWDKIPDETKQSNWMLAIPGTKDYIKIPMPYGFNAIFNIGRNASAVVRGRPVGAAVHSTIFAGVDAFNPVGGTNSFLSLVAPTFLDPLVETSRNRDAFDRPIKPEQNPFSHVKKPESQLFWNNTTPAFKWIAGQINSLSGGSEAIPGAIDLSPAQMDYWFGFLSGGLGRFVQRALNLGTKTVGGDLGDVDANDIAFVRRFVGTAGNRVEQEKYYNVLQDVLEKQQQIKYLIEAHDPQGIRDAREKYKAELSIAPQISAIDRQVTELQSQLKKVRRNEQMDVAAKEQRIDQLRDRIAALIVRANKLYADKVER